MRLRSATLHSAVTLLALGATAAAASTGVYPGDGAPSGTARTTHAVSPARNGSSAVRVSASRIVFPVVGRVQYTNDFGAPRPQGSHEGNDIMAPRRALAVAAEPGRIKFWTHSACAGCMLYLSGKSGTTYLYIHLNNDLTKHNDNRGKCKPGISYAPGLKNGQKVAAGQLVGFVGDSGDANGVATHLHFEVHPHGGRAVSPYKHLNRAYRPLFAVASGSKFTVSLAGKVVSTTPVDEAHVLLRMNVKSLRAWPGGYRVPHVNRTLAVDVQSTDSIEQLGSGPSPAAASVSLQRLLAARKNRKLTVRTAPARRQLSVQLGRAAFDAAAVVLKPRS